MATKGLTQTSSVVSIGFRVDETVAASFNQSQVDLNLSPLDREVFVVLAINLDPQTPDNVAGTTTSTSMSLTSTSQTGIAGLDNANCLATAANVIRQNAGSVDGVAFQTLGLETPPATLEYIGIIATSDFFVQQLTVGNTGLKTSRGKIYGYRARASADIFAALVQSEVLSA